MNTLGYVLFELAAVTLAAVQAQSPFRCDLHSLSKEERSRHSHLTTRLVSAIVEKRQLQDGFAFKLDLERMSLGTVAEWIELERKCCPFFGYRIDVEAERGVTWLHLTGRPGVKEFIESEFKLAH
jgi:hypothetical protein